MTVYLHKIHPSQDLEPSLTQKEVPSEPPFIQFSSLCTLHNHFLDFSYCKLVMSMNFYCSVHAYNYQQDQATRTFPAMQQTPLYSLPGSLPPKETTLLACTHCGA